MIDIVISKYLLRDMLCRDCMHEKAMICYLGLTTRDEGRLLPKVRTCRHWDSGIKDDPRKS